MQRSWHCGAAKDFSKKTAEAIEFEVIESVSGDTLLVADLFTRT